MPAATEPSGSLDLTAAPAESQKSAGAREFNVERHPVSLSGRTYCGQINFRLWQRLDRYLAGLSPLPSEGGLGDADLSTEAVPDS